MKKIFCFTISSVFPSTQSLALARQNGADLGFAIEFVDVETEVDSKNTTASLSRATIDVILILSASPTEKGFAPCRLPQGHG